MALRRARSRQNTSMTRWRNVLALAAAVVGVATAVSLGQWQTNRAEQKLALQREWDEIQRRAPEVVTAGTLAHIAIQAPLRVKLSGRFEHRFTVWLDNRPNLGRAGFNVITPIVVDDGSVVLVNRGWAPRDASDRTRLPAVAQPDGVVVIEGLALASLPRLLELGSQPPPRSWPVLWQNLDYQEFERASGLRVARFVVLQTSEADDQLARNWPAPASGVEKHRGYALQWYSLAGLIVVIALIVGLRARRAR